MARPPLCERGPCRSARWLPTLTNRNANLTALAQQWLKVGYQIPQKLPPPRARAMIPRPPNAVDGHRRSNASRCSAPSRMVTATSSSPAHPSKRTTRTGRTAGPVSPETLNSDLPSLRTDGALQKRRAAIFVLRNGAAPRIQGSLRRGTDVVCAGQRAPLWRGPQVRS